jgi:hypothetical protein
VYGGHLEKEKKKEEEEDEVELTKNSFHSDFVSRLKLAKKIKMPHIF